MNHYQLRRIAVYPLLARYQLLAPILDETTLPLPSALAATSDLNPPGRCKLALRGLALVNQLCRMLDLEVFSVEADDPFLRGSLAKFEPHLPEDQSLGGVIYFSRALSEPERVFAIAHELAHFYLHWGQLTGCHQQDLDVDASPTAGTGDEALLSGGVEVYNPRNLREREANIFALELLMPSDELRETYRHLRTQADIARARGRASPGLSPVIRLAEYFEVSPYRVLMQLSNAFFAPALPPVATIELNEQQAATSVAPAEASPSLPNVLTVDGLLASSAFQVPPIKLDDEQQAAVVVATPALVLAGPGSGKTCTLVERVRYLVTGAGTVSLLDPAQLLILTFSNKAAGELRERLVGAGLPAERMFISTFHAYGVEFLRRYAERIGLPRDFRLLDPAHAYLLMEELLPYLPTGYYINPYNPYGYLKDLLGDISRAKDYLQTVAHYSAAVERMTEADCAYKPEEVAKARERAEIYRVYEQHKQKHGLVDFSDLVMLPVQLLQSDLAVRKDERGRYQQVLVDEFQDINYASGQLLQWLCSPSQGGSGNIWAVGDLNQSIYRFRGAFPQQAGSMAFQQAYGSPTRPATVLELSCNYRSLPSIVSLANHLRETMPPDGANRPLVAYRGTMVSSGALTSSEVAPVLTPMVGGTTVPSLHYNVFPTTVMESTAIAVDIEQHRAAGYTYADHAILCQRHAQADRLAAVLSAAGIPVSRLGPFFNRSEIQEVLALFHLLTNETPLALVKLGAGHLAVVPFLQLVASYGLKPRQALKDNRVLNGLDARSRQQARLVAGLLDRLEGLRSNWFLSALYLFEYSPTLAELLEGPTSELRLAEQQKLRALGQLLRIAGRYDKEEEARLYEDAERKLDRPLAYEEHESLRQARLKPALARRGFLRYINALVQSDTRVELGEETTFAPIGELASNGEAGQVQIITAHTSKGLEFPFVYLPGLHAPGQPPPDPTAPVPPGLHLDGKDDERHREDRHCLFYVSVTRARDALYLSWAEREEDVATTDSGGEGDEEMDEGVSSGSERARGGRLRQPSEELRSALAHQEGYTHQWTALGTAGPLNLTPPVSNPNPGKTVLTQDPAIHLPGDLAQATPPAIFEYGRLNRYEQCPRRYYYQYVMGGQSQANSRPDSEKSQLYAGLDAAQKQLYNGLINEGQLPNLASVLEAYRSGRPRKSSVANSLDVVMIARDEVIKAANANTDHLEAPASAREESGEVESVSGVAAFGLGRESQNVSYYQMRGEQAVKALWRQKETHASHPNYNLLEQAQPVAVEFDVPQTVRLRNNTVSFRLDRVETMPDGSRRLIHSRLKGLPKDEKGLDSDSAKPYRLLALYALANPGAKAHQIVLEAIGPLGTAQMEAPKAYKKADAYQKWLDGKTKSPGLLDRLDRLADRIRAGKFEPKRGEHCTVCPFYTLVCPAGPA